MEMNSAPESLGQWLSQGGNPEDFAWLKARFTEILDPPSARNLFMAYTLIGKRFPDRLPASSAPAEDRALAYLEGQGMTLRALARTYLLIRVLTADPEFFVPKVRQLAQVADTAELVTFLKSLPVLPEANQFITTAVDALRTNISDVFDAIALNNPYPAQHFNTQQWNQMYLKAAFMQRNLLHIPGVEERGNPDLARIISDYAHERWAASRDIDPVFWRPVSPFLDEGLLADMKRLLASANPREQKAGALCCSASADPRAQALLEGHPLNPKSLSEPLSWDDLNS